jgi:hypothetical protein
VLKFLHEQKEFGDSHKQKPKQMEIPKSERGAAEITISLSNSVIEVRHSDGTLLHRVRAFDGDWNKLWEAIHKLGK